MKQFLKDYPELKKWQYKKFYLSPLLAKEELETKKLGYSIKRKAHELVSLEIKKGNIIKQPCIECGEIKSEAHHENYLKPLEIIWLCKKHHTEADKKRKLGKTF